VNLQGVGVDEEGLGFAFPREHWHTVRTTLDGLIIPMGEPSAFYLFQFGEQPSQLCQIQQDMLRKAGLGERVRLIPIAIAEGCTMVSLIADGYSRQPGIFAELHQTLLEAGIPIWQTADSELSLSCIIPESEVEKAVRLIHDRFALDAVAR
jgi:aspartate kinase